MRRTAPALSPARSPEELPKPQIASLASGDYTYIPLPFLSLLQGKCRATVGDEEEEEEAEEEVEEPEELTEKEQEWRPIISVLFSPDAS